VYFDFARYVWYKLRFSTVPSGAELVSVAVLLMPCFQEATQHDTDIQSYFVVFLSLEALEG
jgi:bacteriorhodopsin